VATNGKNGFAPIQLIVCTYKGDYLPNRVREYFEMHRDGDHPMRLVGAILIEKNEDGSIDRKHWNGLDEWQERRFEAVAGALIGMGAGAVEAHEHSDAPGARFVGARVGARVGAWRMARHEHGMSEEELAEVLEDVPPGSSAFIGLIEHPWILEAREKFEQAGGTFFAHGWVTPRTLIRMGARAALRENVRERVGAT
jgi:uncharacterized membrane protein